MGNKDSSKKGILDNLPDKLRKKIKKALEPIKPSGPESINFASRKLFKRLKDSEKSK